MIGIPNKISEQSATLLYYLLYSHYGNSTVAMADINQFKYSIFSKIFMYGPTWEKRLEIQEKLRGLTDDDILRGSTQIYNHSYNPSTAPNTSTLDELPTINEQNTQKSKRDPLSAYSNLLALIETDVTKEFIDKFKELFIVVVSGGQPLYYGTPLDEKLTDTDYDGLWYKGYEGTAFGTHINPKFSQVYESVNDFLADYNAQ